LARGRDVAGVAEPDGAGAVDEGDEVDVGEADEAVAAGGDGADGDADAGVPAVAFCAANDA